MDIRFKEQFIRQWEKYFGHAELPVTFYYSSGDGGAFPAGKKAKWSCLIGELAKVRKGTPVYYDAEMVSCGGAKRYLGYTRGMRPGFEHFLSCGNETIEGERYKQTPAIVTGFMNNQEFLDKKGLNLIFKRWDQLLETDDPEVVIFFATPDVLSGLFTLANYDQSAQEGVFVPFGSGCGSIVYYPLLEARSENPRAVIGMFDPSARPFVPENVLTFAVPVKRFEKMAGFMDESFLITPSWQKVRKRIKK